MEKLGNKQTKDRIADMLRTEILSGRIADGDELVQEQLAEALEVSRMPIREALQILELEGLLLRLPNRHMQVVGLNESIVQDNLRIIAAVEAEIMMLLLEHGCEIPEEMDYQDNYSFHCWFSKQLGNPYLSQTHQRLLNNYPKFVWNNVPSGQLAEQNEQIWSEFSKNNDADLQDEVRAYYQRLAQMLLSCGKEN